MSSKRIRNGTSGAEITSSIQGLCTSQWDWPGDIRGGLCTTALDDGKWQWRHTFHFVADHQTLLHPEVHTELLDLYGKCNNFRDEFSKIFFEHQAQTKILVSMKMGEKELIQKQEFLSFQLKEIDEAHLSEEEEEEIKAERNKLKYAGQIREGLQKCQSLLTDEGGSIIERLGQVLKELESVQNIDPSLGEPVERSRSAFYEIEEVVESLRNYDRSLEFNPSRLEDIEDRLAEISGLKRKYGNDIAEIIKRREKIAEELEPVSYTHLTLPTNREV